MLSPIGFHQRSGMNRTDILSTVLFCPGVYLISQLTKILNNIFQLLKALDDVNKTNNFEIKKNKFQSSKLYPEHSSH